MSEQKKLIEIPLKYLWNGLVLKDDVYDKNGTVLLIPKGELITDRKLQRLNNFATEDYCVTTYENSVKVILKGRKATPEEKQQILEEETGYTELKDEVSKFLEISRHATQIENDIVESVIVDVIDKMKNANTSAIFGCIHVPRPLDENLQRHCLNVGFLNGLIGQWLELSEQDIRMLVMAGVLHDIGKTKIPEEILFLPRKLTAEEYEVVKKHSEYSYQLLGDQFDRRIEEAVLYHHERNNGTGYPKGLEGNEIPLFARITAISDVYDAMISARSYKNAIIPFEILERVKKSEFQGLDPILTSVFVKNMIKQYRYSQVKMSDGTQGDVVYIPPNDIQHPIVKVNEVIRQIDDTWYCIQVL